MERKGINWWANESSEYLLDKKKENKLEGSDYKMK